MVWDMIITLPIAIVKNTGHNTQEQKNKNKSNGNFAEILKNEINRRNKDELSRTMPER